MGGREDLPVGDAARRVFEEASQVVLRSLDLKTSDGPVAPFDMTKLTASAARVATSVRSACTAGPFARRPVQTAFGAIEMACGVVEAAAGASRRVASRVLGKEPGSTDPSADSNAGASATRFDPSTGRAGPEAPDRAQLAAIDGGRPGRARAASVTSPILGHTDWAGRMASPGSVSVMPGDIARVPIRIENRTNRAVRSVRLRSTDFVARGGNLIDDRAVRIEPRVVNLAPASAQTVVVEIHIPADAGPGRYTGVIAALGLPQSGSTVELNVR